MKTIWALLILYIALPSVAQAKILINEIAWMGVLGEGGANGEWVELYNSAQSQDITDWLLYKKQGEVETKLAVLSGIVESGGFFVLERTTKTMPDPIVGVADGQLLSGLINLPKGEYLVLRDSSGNLIDELDASGGWPAGDNQTKYTMQLTHTGSWITASPTPAQENVQREVVIDTKKEVSTKSPDSTTAIKKATTKENTIAVIAPDKVYAGIYMQYGASATFFEKKKQGVFVWNMGDGTILETKNITNVSHEYRYPGTYTISLVYKNKKTNEPILSVQKTLSVVSSNIAITKKENDAIAIVHTENIPLDISGWYIRVGAQQVVIPDFTVLAAKGSIVFLLDRLGLAYNDQISLLDDKGRIISASGTESFEAETRTTSNQGSKAQSGSGVKTVVLEEAQSIFIKNPEEKVDNKQKSHTKYIVIGAASIVGIGLLLLLERFIAQKE